MGDAVAGNVFSADRYELARIRSDGNAVLEPEGPRTTLGVFSVFVYVTGEAAPSPFKGDKRGSAGLYHTSFT